MTEPGRPQPTHKQGTDVMQPLESSTSLRHDDAIGVHRGSGRDEA